MIPLAPASADPLDPSTLATPSSAPATISGVISSDFGIPPEIAPGLRDDETGHLVQFEPDYDAETGRYTLTNIPPGKYTLSIAADSQYWLPLWWNDSLTAEGASTIIVKAGDELTGYDFSLVNVPTIEGTVTTVDETGAVVPVQGLTVSADPVDSDASPYLTATDAAGRYLLPIDVPGRYDVTFGNAQPFAPYPVPLHRNWATVDVGVLDFRYGTVYTGYDVRVERAGRIDGAITTYDGREDARFFVVASRWDESQSAWVEYTSDLVGREYQLAGLPAGDYRVRFVQASRPENRYRYRSEYYVNELYPADATLVTVRAEEATSGIDARLEKLEYSVFRVGGVDRYAVSAAVSARTFEPGVPVVYVASGENYPDALSAGPAAAHQGGSLLLVGRDSIPEAVRAELLRLKPGRIVVVGGPASVSPTVVSQLAALAPESMRIGGADRYEVSRRVVSYAFCGSVDASSCPAGIDSAFFATGANYPDALSAGPAAAHEGGPVLLVHGGDSEVDSQTAALIDRLGIERGSIVGGRNSMSAGVEASLKSRIGEVTRFDGADRFEVSYLIARDVFGKAETAFLASGEKFPDALSGGAAAATLGAPVLLVHRDCIPSSTSIMIQGLNPIDVVLLGGENSLSDGVFSLKSVCAS